MWSIGLSMAPLWLPSGAGADPTTKQCVDIGDKIWGQRSRELPKNQSSIDMLMKLAVDCPALAGSMERLAKEIKAHLERQAEASGNVKKVGEKYQSSAYDPGGSDFGPGSNPN